MKTEINIAWIINDAVKQYNAREQVSADGLL